MKNEIEQVKKLPQMLEAMQIKKKELEDLIKDQDGIVINGVDDKEGFKAAKGARILIKNNRLSITKETDEALKPAKAIVEEITNFKKEVQEIAKKKENEFSEMEIEYERLNDERKQREIEKTRKKYQDRVMRIQAFGPRFDGIVFELQSNIFDHYAKTNTDLISIMSDEEFEEKVKEFELINHENEVERLRVKEEEKIKNEIITKRRELMAPYSQYSNIKTDEQYFNLSDEEFEKELQNCKGAKEIADRFEAQRIKEQQEKEAENERIRLENEKIQKELEAEREKIRLEQQKIKEQAESLERERKLEEEKEKAKQEAIKAIEAEKLRLEQKKKEEEAKRKADLERQKELEPFKKIGIELLGDFVPEYINETSGNNDVQNIIVETIDNIVKVINEGIEKIENL